MTWLAVFIGGGLGSLARFGVSKLALVFLAKGFPFGTMLANILSCLVLGIGLSLFSGKIENETVKAFWIIGFCGGFSTFSTFSLETFSLIKQGSYGYAVGNILVSLIACLLVIYFFLRSKPA